MSGAAGVCRIRPQLGKLSTVGCLRVCLTWAVDGLLNGSPYSKTGASVEVFNYIDALTRSFAGTVGPRFTA